MVAGLGRVSPEIGPDTKHRYFTVTTGPSRLTPQLHSEPPGQRFFWIKKKFASFLEVWLFNDFTGHHKEESIGFHVIFVLLHLWDCWI